MNSYNELRKGMRFAILTVSAVMLLTGCTTSKLDLPDSERFPAPQAIVTDGEDQAADVEANGPSVTGKYPGFSQPLRAASIQMTDVDVAKMQKQLAGLSRKRSSGAITDAQYKARVEELRKLAAEHGAETIKEIQN